MSDNSRSGGFGIGTVLFLIFLILKLTNTINWSWWWIISPLLIPIGLTISMLVVACIVIGGVFLAAGSTVLIVFLWERHIEKKEVKENSGV